MTPVNGAKDVNSRSALVIVAIAIVVLAVLAGVGVLKIRALLIDWAVQHQGIDVPCLYGMEVEEARDMVHDGLNISNVSLELRVVGTRPTTDIAPGRVLQQDPGCKATLTRIRPVNVVVSRSPQAAGGGT